MQANILVSLFLIAMIFLVVAGYSYHDQEWFQRIINAVVLLFGAVTCFWGFAIVFKLHDIVPGAVVLFISLCSFVAYIVCGILISSHH